MTEMKHIIPRRSMTKPARKISIGKLSEATNIPIPTLRTWERRYNFPVSERTEGNHRLYDVSLVPHLRLVVETLAKGHRAKQVLGLSVQELQALVGETKQPDVTIEVLETSSDVDALFELWLADVKALNSKACLAHFRLGLSQFGLKRFVLERIIPFVSRIGCAWHDGELQIFQEHFATRLIGQFIEEHWQLINASNTGPTIILSSHPLEKHTLGFHLVASILVLEGYTVVLLGNNTPIDEIVACAEQTKALAIALTFSITMDPTDVEHFLQNLSDHIVRKASHQPSLIIGGSGVPIGMEKNYLVHHSLETLGQIVNDL